MTDLEILSGNIRRHRLFKGLSQKELAAKVGVTQDTISKIELGKQENPGLKYLKRICQELDIAIEELFMENPKKLKIEIIASEQNIKVVEAFVEAFRNLNLITGGEKK